MVSFEKLEYGAMYDRNHLAKLWGYDSFQAISRGVVTPSKNNLIILFVTKLNLETLTQYNDHIDKNHLYWEGEKKHRSDMRIINARINGDEIHLFYRDKHHMAFIYYGQVYVKKYILNADKPSEFVFRINNENEDDILKDIEQIKIENRSLDQTEVDSIIKSRLGHGRFRKDLIELWGSCSLTGMSMISVLKASHIKAWKDSSNLERLDPYNGLLFIPNIDTLFDRGFITFEDSGKIIISKNLSKENMKLIGVDSDMHLVSVFPENFPYLRYHRENVFIN